MPKRSPPPPRAPLPRCSRRRAASMTSAIGSILEHLLARHPRQLQIEVEERLGRVHGQPWRRRRATAADRRMLPQRLLRLPAAQLVDELTRRVDLRSAGQGTLLYTRSCNPTCPRLQPGAPARRRTRNPPKSMYQRLQPYNPEAATRCGAPVRCRRHPPHTPLPPQSSGRRRRAQAAAAAPRGCAPSLRVAAPYAALVGSRRRRSWAHRGGTPSAASAAAACAWAASTARPQPRTAARLD
eukprot:scaffold94700_cov65-Phaeocystis_antarctica.AAC.8